MYYVPVTRNPSPVPAAVPFKTVEEDVVVWCSSKMVRWRTKIKQTTITSPKPVCFLGFHHHHHQAESLCPSFLFFYPFRLPIYSREMASWDGMGWRDGSWMMMMMRL